MQNQSLLVQLATEKDLLERQMEKKLEDRNQAVKKLREECAEQDAVAKKFRLKLEELQEAKR